jgi:hypothetical protein
MTAEELKQVKHFDKKEIEATGAKLEDVQLRLLLKMDKLRDLIGRRIRLLNNGLTTGNHKSAEHPQGEACDFYLDPRDGKTDYYFVFKCAIDAGFNKLGVYWNGTQYSFHVASASKSAFWSATKTKTGEPWKFDGLIVDPAKKLSTSSPLAATIDPD